MKKIYMILAAITLLSMSLNAQTTYVKVTSADQLEAGKKYILVCDDYNLALTSTATGNYLAGEDVTINNNTVTISDDSSIAEFTLEGQVGNWNLACDNKYLNASSSSGNLKLNNNATSWTITNDNGSLGGFRVKHADANRAVIYFSDYSRFGNYAYSNIGDKYSYAWMYVESESTPPTPTAELTAPVSGSTVFVGTTSAELPSVSKEIPISGNYLTKDLTATITGEGFSFLTRDITVPYADVNAATASVTVVYNGTDENATGTLTLSSDEVSAVVNLTASYRKPAVLTTVPAGYVVQDKKTPNQIVTAVIETTVDLYHGEVVSVTYVNSLGMTSDKPFEGVNIVITRYSDGTTSTSKVMQ